MQLVEVHVIGLEAPQAALDGLGYVAPVEPRGLAAHVVEGVRRAGHLGRQDHLVAPAAGFEPVADDLLRAAVGLAAGGDEYISAVSMKLTPRSSAVSSWAKPSASLFCSPQVIDPRQMTLTSMSLRPSRRYCMRIPLEFDVGTVGAAHRMRASTPV